MCNTSYSFLEITITSTFSHTPFLLNFGFLRRPQNLKKIFVALLIRASCSVCATVYLSKSWWRYSKTSVDKSYYTNFTIIVYVNFYHAQSIPVFVLVLENKWFTLGKTFLMPNLDNYINKILVRYLVLIYWKSKRKIGTITRLISQAKHHLAIFCIS